MVTDFVTELKIGGVGRIEGDRQDLVARGKDRRPARDCRRMCRPAASRRTKPMRRAGRHSSGVPATIPAGVAQLIAGLAFATVS